MKGKWALLALLCAIFVTYTVDRALLGLLAVPIQNELGLGNTMFGVLSAAIFWTYSVCVPFSGLVGDRFNRARVIGLAAVAWSAMTFLAGFAGGFWSLFALCSVAIVVPQTLYSPCANALIAEHHDSTRTVALSAHQAAYYTGWLLSGVLVASVLALFGSWRWVFFVCGSVGLAVGAVFIACSRMFARSAVAGAAASTVRPPTLGESLKAFFGCRTAMLVAVCYVTEVFVSCGYGAWGPKFVAGKFHLSAAAAGTGVMFWHYAAALAAILVTGFVTDRCVVRMPRFRLALSATALVASMPVLVVFGTSESLPTIWAAAAALGALIGVIGANQFTAIFDVVPSNCRSGALGFLNVIAGLVGSLAPIGLGWLSDHDSVSVFGYGGFELGFSSMSLVQLLAAAALAFAMFVTFGKDRARLPGRSK